MNRLTNKVALVTGGSRGMGAAIALRLAQEGADVVLTCVKGRERAAEVAAEIERLGRRALVCVADSADPEAVRAAVARTVTEFGRIDILVNNAGIFDARPIEGFSLDDYARSMDINVRAVFVASQAALAHMGAGGRIISIGSNLAGRVPGEGMTLYSLSKAALVGFTRALAREVGPRGVTVNVVHPGSTNTEMNPAESAHAEMQRSRMAIPHFAEPVDIAGLVAWVASEEGRYMTGAELTLDSGTNA